MVSGWRVFKEDCAVPTEVTVGNHIEEPMNPFSCCVRRLTVTLFLLYPSSLIFTSCHSEFLYCLELKMLGASTSNFKHDLDLDAPCSRVTFNFGTQVGHPRVARNKQDGNGKRGLRPESGASDVYHLALMVTVPT